MSRTTKPVMNPDLTSAGGASAVAAGSAEAWATLNAAAPGVGRSETDWERAPTGALLLEVSWEVCNQLGGIYQVIRSKASAMQRRWRNRYFLVGPYNASKAALEFEERRATGWLGQALDGLEAQGLVVHHGRWLIPGRPKVLLIEHSAGRGMDVLKFELWDRYGIETPAGNWFIDGAVTFGDAVRRLAVAMATQWATGGVSGPSAEDDEAEEVSGAGGGGTGIGGATVVGRRVILHAHEWMAGLAIPALRRDHGELSIASVFTTHATQLGRTLAWGSPDVGQFYEHLSGVDAATSSRAMGIGPQHEIERLCAGSAHVFSTVSPITGEECTHLLGRTPDIVLPNGLNIEAFNVGHEFQTLHAEYKRKIHLFTMGHFFPSYSFDLDSTIYLFTSGRFEPRNKGFDLCLEAMARLNAEIRASGLDRTVVLFIITQRPVRSIHPSCLQQRGVLNELRDVCASITEEIGEQLFRKAAAREGIKLEDMVSEYWNIRFRRTQQAMTTDRLPPVVTHVLEDDQRDEVLNQVRNLWLFNRPEDPVKIVYHPEFISPTNPLWGLEYEQFVRGCHMGIFPSAYEPWGYTPLECMAMGVPSVTSDLAGFGRYVQQTHPEMESPGLYILRRRGRSYHDAAGDLTRHLLEFCRMDRRGRIAMRNQVEHRSWAFDWGKLVRAYDWAQDLAMARAAAERAGL